MSTSVGRIDLDLGLNYGGFKKDLKGIAPKTTSLVSGAFGKLGGIAAAAFTAKALYSFGKGAINLASDLVEVQNVVDVTFGKMAENVNQFSKQSLEQFGLSELSAKKYTSTMGAMLKSSGFGVKAAANMSIEMTKLSADMASFYNLENEVAFNKIRSGLSGETEPLKQLGINMNVANLEAYALSQGIKTSYKNMSQAEQVMLRYNYLLKASADSQGDFARNSQTWANQVKILTERWKEFMALIGTALMEILLPAVKFLNNALSVLISITKEVGKIYSMVTGKNVIATATNEIGSSADDAADSEKDLGKEIDKAGKAAKKALAPFDELNVLHKDMGKDKGGTGFGDVGDFKTEIKTEQVEDGLGKLQRDGEKFYLWFSDWWTKIKELSAQPIQIPAPVFDPIKSPVYEPNWGLVPPLIPAPVFPSIDVPVYKPKWGLDVPKIPAPVFPKIRVPVYEPDWGLKVPSIPMPVFPTLKVPIFEPVWNLTPPPVPVPIFPAINAEPLKKSLEEVKTWSVNQYGVMKKDVTDFLGNVVKNFETHKTNLGIVTTAIGGIVVANTKSWLKTKSENVKSTLGAIQTNLQTYGKNAAAIAGATASGIALNFNEGYKKIAENTSNFASAMGRGFVDLGGGLLKAAGETARGFVGNFVSGFATVWSNFTNLLRNMGEKVTGYFRENKEVVIKTAITGAVVGAGLVGLALTAPAAIPFVGAALQGLSAIPAFAKGGIVNSPTLAMIGEAGKEAVMPLENNTGWITELAYKIAEMMGGMGGSSEGSPIALTIKIGEDTLLEYLIEAIQRENRIKGEMVVEI